MQPLLLSGRDPVRSGQFELVGAKYHTIINPGDLAALKSAIDALTTGEPRLFVELMKDDVVWDGAAQGWLWWRTAPS